MQQEVFSAKTLGSCHERRVRDALICKAPLLRPFWFLGECGTREARRFVRSTGSRIRRHAAWGQPHGERGKTRVRILHSRSARCPTYIAKPLPGGRVQLASKTVTKLSSRRRERLPQRIRYRHGVACCTPAPRDGTEDERDRYAYARAHCALGSRSRLRPREAYGSRMNIGGGLHAIARVPSNPVLGLESDGTERHRVEAIFDSARWSVAAILRASSTSREPPGTRP